MKLNTLNRFIKIFALIIVLFVNTNKVLAISETYIYSTIKLSTIAGALPQNYDCYDTKAIPVLPFTGYTVSPYVLNTDFSFKSIKNSIKVSIDRSDLTYFNINRDIRLKLKVNAYDANGTQTMTNVAIALDLKYKPGLNQIEDDAAVYMFENAVWFNVVVDGITDFNNVSIAGTFATAYPEVDIDLITEFDRIYNFDVTYANSSTFKNSVQPFAPYIIPYPPVNCLADNYLIKWNDVIGAEAWEIEWQLLEDDYDPTTNVATVDFRNNATRVRINGYNSPGPTFKIPGIYEKGILIYRVRPIFKNMSTFVEGFGPWSMQDVTLNYNLTIPSLNTYIVLNYNEDINWTKSVAFAEDGKYKNVITYFDGALKSRQTITINTTDNTPIIAQAVYDFTGRPVIQLLPTPSLDNSNLCFRSNFNISSGSSSAYNYENFDLTDGNSCSTELKVVKMDNSSGASKYYSTNGYNNSTMQSWQAFVPDANGYPFTQVEYMPDNTGRISRQSGVGPKHRLSGIDQNNTSIDGKETSFLYGKPFQAQLDLLFGYEVGRAEHYKRNVVIDANGQSSVSYLDPYGRVVATSLSGNPGSNSGLSPIASSSMSYEMTISTFDNKTDYSKSAKIIEQPITVTNTTNYFFDYTVDARVFAPECTPEGICFDCVYDLEFSLKKFGCDEELIPEGSRSVMVGNIEPFDLTCNAVGFDLAPQTPLSIQLEAGSYIFKKILKINKKAMEYYRTQYWNNNTCLKTLEDFINEEKEGMDINNKCIYTCVECNEDLETLNERKTVLQNLGENRTDEEDEEYSGIEAKINKQEELCSNLCKTPTPCEILLESILSDVRPGGQYAPTLAYDELTGTTTNAFTDANSILNESNTLMGTCSTKNWRHPLNPVFNGSSADLYYNENGTQALILVENNYPSIVSGKLYYNSDGSTWTYGPNPKYVRPQDLLNIEDFVKFYQSNTSWARSLKYYHPEYCYYVKCKNIEPTYEYNNRLLAENDAEEAKKKGYFNPVNNPDVTYDPSSNTDPYLSLEVTPDKEPLFTSPLNFGDFDYAHLLSFRNHLYDYPINDPNNVHKSIWDLYNDMLVFDNLDQNDKNCAGDPNWPFLRALYIAAKDDILRDYYKSTSNCSTSCPGCPGGANCIGEITLPAGKIRRFPLDGSAVNQDPINLGGSDDDNFDNGKGFVDGKIEEYCADKCESYMEYWERQLSQCNLFADPLFTNKANLLNDLKLVCIEGCDEDNLLGSREMAPGKILNHPDGTPINFNQVFAKYFGPGVWLDPGICDELILEWPMGYNHDYSAYEGPFADTCACKKKNYAKYNPNCTPNDIPEPLDNCACEIKNVELRHTTLSKLDIPDELKCQNCIDCRVFNRGYSAFIARYGSTVVNGLSDKLFEELLEKWMNLFLGFNLTYAEYLDFAGKCKQMTVAPTRSVWEDFENVKWVSSDRKFELPNLDQPDISEPTYWVENKTDSILTSNSELIVTKVKKLDWENKSDFERNIISASQKYNSYQFASLDNQLYAMATSSADADKLACHCEKILTSRWYKNHDNINSLDDVSMFNKMFGSGMFNNQGDYDKAYKVCCNAFNLNNPPVNNCDQTSFVPGSKFNQSQKDYFDNNVLSPNTNSVFIDINNVKDFQGMLDNNCTNPLQSDNKRQLVDKCACEKIMQAKANYINTYSQTQYDNNSPSPTFEEYMYQQYGVTASDLRKVEKFCKLSFESGSGENGTGGQIPWGGLGSNWTPVALSNLARYADPQLENLFVPEKLLCAPNPPPPCIVSPPDCMTMKWVLKEFLAQTTLPSNLTLGNPYASNTASFDSYNFYSAWELLNEAYLNHKSSSNPDPDITAFFNSLVNFANSHILIRKNCPSAKLTISQILWAFKQCESPPCKPDCSYFSSWFTTLKQDAITNNSLPSSLNANSTLKDFYLAALDNYYSDILMKDIVDEFLEKLNAELKKKCPVLNRNVTFTYYEIWSMMWTCIDWPDMPEPCEVCKKIVCTSCYEIDYDYLKAFENFLNQISKGWNVFTPNADKLHSDNWLLINPGIPRDVDEFYNSVLYTGSNSTTLRYNIEDNSYGVPYMEVDVYDASGYRFIFSLEFPEDISKFHYAYIRKFSNIKPLGRVNCGLPKGYEVDAEIYINGTLNNATETYRMHGAFLKGDYASFTTCFDTCVRLCNKPQIPAPVIDEDPCEKMLLRIAYTNALMKYDEYREAKNRQFETEYKTHCLGVGETMEIKFNQNEYHFTLYYYDQAGNLIKTVPPEGVDFTHSDITTSQRNQMVDERLKMAEDFITHKYQYSNVHKPYINHMLISHYKYNTLNQLIWQKTPDGGESRFWYDNLGRLVVSQNAKQAVNGLYSYTLFDDFGRTIEVGEKNTTSTMDFATAGSLTSLITFLNSGTNTQVTRTEYDEVDLNDPVMSTSNPIFTSSRSFMRHRVAANYFFENTPPVSPSYKGQGCNSATHFSYDIHGNVNELVQEIPLLSGLEQQFKKISYEYDLLSSKVNAVHYQTGKPDQMHHRYNYDADNRLRLVETSRDGWNYTLDAKYFYYLHGPLSRIELGDYNQKVQGLDYSYTLQGWIKSVNGPSLSQDIDMGKDGNQNLSGNLNGAVARDAFAFMLHYYDSDYTSVGGSGSNFQPSLAGSNLLAAKYDLYNGNIPFMQTSLPDVTSYSNNSQIVNNSLGNVYRYDQLNRIVEHKVFENYNLASNSWQYTSGLNGTDQYFESFSYDPNGNIRSLTRNGDVSGAGMQMDDLTYQYSNAQNYNGKSIAYDVNNSTGFWIYPKVNNRLYHVNDAVIGNYSNDIDDQGTKSAPFGASGGIYNYEYDEIGNLIKDKVENIDNIEWNVCGKIKKITHSGNNDKSDLEFGYDVSGQRLYKIVKGRVAGVLDAQKDWKTIIYVRDSKGSVMGIYELNYEEINAEERVKEKVYLNELYLYGSNKLGLYSDVKLLAMTEYQINGYNSEMEFIGKSQISNTLITSSVPNLPSSSVIFKGKKQFELSNHLCNVLATISDRRIAVDDNNNLMIDYYNSDIKNIQDYFAFGSIMEGRKYSISQEYRYGFNNQEKDDEISGMGNSTNAEFWQYNTRLGRRFNIDPVVKEFESSYATFGGNPILFNDINGDDWYKPVGNDSRWTWSNDVTDEASAIKVGGAGSRYAHIGYIYPSGDKYVELGSNGNWLYLNPANDKHINDIITGKYVYTQYYGWVDKGHAFTGDGPGKLFDQMFPSDDKRYNNGFKVSYSQGNDPISSLGIYWVKDGLSYDDKVSVACAIFQQISLRYEHLQYLGGPPFTNITSGYSPEDLPSNMLGLYRSVYFGYSEETIMNLIKPLTVSQSLEVYRKYPGTFSDEKYKNRTFSPIYFPNRYSPINPVVPAALRIIKPATANYKIWHEINYGGGSLGGW